MEDVGDWSRSPRRPPPRSPRSALRSSGCAASLKNRISGSTPASRASVRIRRPSARNRPSRAPVLLVAQAARLLDQRIGEGGDLARHSASLLLVEPRLDQRRRACSTACSAPTPVALIVIESPIAAPSIISPMIEVPQTLVPSFSTSICGVDLRGEGDELGAGAGMQAALVARPRRSRLTRALKPRPRRGSRRRPRYICGRPRARRRPRRWTSIVLRAPSRRISIGRLTPAITSILLRSSSARWRGWTACRRTGR